MSTFVLVHGSFHGAWCWEKVVPLLEAGGHRAIAVDLPGHGADSTPLAQRSLGSYVERVLQVIDAQPEPSVLVGHSMGGVVVTQAAEERPDGLSRLVYVAAFLPRDGEALRTLAMTDTESHLGPNLVFGDGLHWCRDEAVVDVFFHDCSDGEAASARARLVKETAAIVLAPVRITAARHGRVARTYIECTDDRALGITQQRRIHAATPCRVLSLPSSHSPFYSMPEALVAHLTA